MSFPSMDLWRIKDRKRFKQSRQQCNGLMDGRFDLLKKVGRIKDRKKEGRLIHLTQTHIHMPAVTKAPTHRNIDPPRRTPAAEAVLVLLASEC